MIGLPSDQLPSVDGPRVGQVSALALSAEPRNELTGLVVAPRKRRVDLAADVRRRRVVRVAGFSRWMSLNDPTMSRRPPPATLRSRRRAGLSPGCKRSRCEHDRCDDRKCRPPLSHESSCSRPPKWLAV